MYIYVHVLLTKYWYTEICDAYLISDYNLQYNGYKMRTSAYNVYDTHIYKQYVSNQLVGSFTISTLTIDWNSSL